MGHVPFAQDHGEQSVGPQLGQQRQSFLQLVLRLLLVRHVVQAELRLEAEELRVLVMEVQLVFHWNEARKPQKKKDESVHMK